MKSFFPVSRGGGEGVGGGGGGDFLMSLLLDDFRGNRNS